MQNIIIKNFLLFSLLILWLSSSSQDMIVYDEHKNLEIIFKYNPYESDSSLPNFFINNLAKSQSKIRSYFKYSISTKTNGKLIKKSHNKYEIKLNIDKISYEGNFIYKGFNFQKQCLPNNIFHTYSILERNSNRQYKKKIELSIFNSHNIDFDSIFIDSSKAGSFTIIDEKLNISFDKEQKDEFAIAINNITNYYSDGITIDQLDKELNLLQINNIDKIQLQSIDIKYIKKQFEKINIPKYALELSLQTTDPAGIYIQYKIVKLKIDSLYEQFRNQLKILDSLYYAKAIQYLQDSNTNKCSEYLDKSLKFNPEYIPSMIKLAEIDYNEGQLINSKSYLNKILAITSKNKKANILAKQTYEALLQKGISLNSEERYNEGLNVLEKANEFCTKNMHILACDSIQEPAINKSKYGMYSSYLSIAGASMQRGRFDMTEDYLNTAYKYQIKYPKAIDNTKEVDALFTLLITQYLRLSIEESASYHQRKSDNYIFYADSLSKAHKLSDAMSFVSETKLKLKDKNFSHSEIAKASIKNNKLIDDKEYSKVEFEFISKEQIAQNSYKLHLDKALVYYQYRRYALAYPEFKEAKHISQHNNIAPYDLLDTYLMESAKNVILKQISNGSLQAWAGRYKTAELTEKNAIIEISNNNLQDDNDIKIKLLQLKEDIQKQADSRQSKKFDINMQKAKKSIEFDDYLSVFEYCNTAIGIANKNPQIPLNITYPESILKKYQYAILYQQQIKEVKILCKENHNSEAINAFIKAENILKNINQSNTKVNRITINKLANECSSTGFYNSGITYLIERNLLDDAFSLWKSSLKNGIIISDKTAINCMMHFGNYDKKKYPNAKKKQLYKSRFNNSKSFIKYKKYYYKGLKHKNI